MYVENFKKCGWKSIAGKGLFLKAQTKAQTFNQN